MMTSSGIVTTAAAVLPQCVIGVLLLMTSLTQLVTAQVGLTSTNNVTYSPSSPPAFSSQQPTGDVIVTSSTLRSSIANARIRAETGILAKSLNRTITRNDSLELIPVTASSMTSSSTHSQQIGIDDELTDTNKDADGDDGEQLDREPEEENNEDDQEEQEEEQEQEQEEEDADANQLEGGDYTDNRDIYDYLEYKSNGAAPSYNFSSDADDSSLHRLMMTGSVGSRPEPINMSLLVIYSWLALVVVMIVITVIIYKYKEPMNNAWQSIHMALCHRSKRSRGIEESNTLLTHPLV